MARLKTGLSGLNPVALASKSEELEIAMTGNTDFPTPEPSLADITAARVELQTLIARARFGDRRVKELRDLKAAELKTLLNKLAKYVALVANGDRRLIVSSGFGVVKTPEPLPPLERPKDLEAMRSKQEGSVLLDWKSVKGTLNYLVEMTTDDPRQSDPNWSIAGYTSKSKFQVDNLTPGTKYWFRVRSLGARDKSPYSDPALVMAA
jgi:hypothetical protein